MLIIEDDNILFNKNSIDTEVDNFINVGGMNNNLKDFTESNLRKRLSNKWDIITSWSINLGNHHFAITINMPIEFEPGEEKLSHLYDEFNEEWYTRTENIIKELIFDNFPTTTFCFIVSEKNKKGILHFHCLVGIRNIIDYNYCIKNNLILLFKEFTLFSCYNDSDFDIKVESLKYFKDIKNWAIYMYKDMYKWKLYSIIYVIEKYIQEPIINCLGDITWFFLQINCKIESIKNNVVHDLQGIKLVHNTINQRTLINILQYYLILNNYYIYNDDIYVKIENTKISYKNVGSIKEILYDKFQENVISFFIINYFYYFNGFDFNYLITMFLVKSKNLIESLKDITTNKIIIDFSILEFNDGIYYIKNNKFVPKNSITGKILDEVTIKYYDKSYNRVRKSKPLNWINGLKHALNLKDNENIENNLEFEKIYTTFVNIFHKNNIKKSTLFIVGPSNSGKTTLIVFFLINFFGSKNIGWVISAKNFKWQDLLDKLIGIIDEGRYNSSMSSDLLKITGQENIIVEKKYSKNHMEIKPLPLFVLTNSLFKEKDDSINQALNNRILIVKFINTVPKEDLKKNREFKEKIKNEEANIIVYCNKLYFKLKDNKNKLIPNTTLEYTQKLK